MPFWGKRNEGKQHFKQAKNYADPNKKEFNLRQAIDELKLAISLKPDEPDYHAELGLIYLQVPELAVIRQVNAPFSVKESANRALAEFKEARSLSDKYSTHLALAYWCLGDYKKVIRFAAGLEEGWEVLLPKKNVEVILKAIGEFVSTLQSTEEILMLLAMIGDFVTRNGRDEATKFTKEAKELGLVEIRENLEVSSPQPEEARRHLEQAVTYRNLGKCSDAMRELEQARQFAPSLFWWYKTLCELGR